MVCRGWNSAIEDMSHALLRQRSNKHSTFVLWLLPKLNSQIDEIIEEQAEAERRERERWFLPITFCLILTHISIQTTETWNDGEETTGNDDGIFRRPDGCIPPIRTGTPRREEALRHAFAQWYSYRIFEGLSPTFCDSPSLRLPTRITKPILSSIANCSASTRLFREGSQGSRRGGRGQGIEELFYATCKDNSSPRVCPPAPNYQQTVVGDFLHTCPSAEGDHPVKPKFRHYWTQSAKVRTPYSPHPSPSCIDQPHL